MAVPKRKTSNSKKKMRRSHHKLSSVNIIDDKKSGESADLLPFIIKKDLSHMMMYVAKNKS